MITRSSHLLGLVLTSCSTALVHWLKVPLGCRCPQTPILARMAHRRLGRSPTHCWAPHRYLQALVEVQHRFRVCASGPADTYEWHPRTSRFPEK